jgi:hypothetical protein
VEAVEVMEVKERGRGRATAVAVARALVVGARRAAVVLVLRRTPTTACLIPITSLVAARDISGVRASPGARLRRVTVSCCKPCPLRTRTYELRPPERWRDQVDRRSSSYLRFRSIGRVGYSGFNVDRMDFIQNRRTEI